MTCPESDEEPSFLQILYHSITTKVVAINIQVSEAVIQDVFFYHSSITSEACRFYHTIAVSYTHLTLPTNSRV